MRCHIDFSQLGIDASRLKRYFDFAPPVVVTKISGWIRNSVIPIRVPEPCAVESVELRETVGIIEGTAKTAVAGAHQDGSQLHVLLADLILRRFIGRRIRWVSADR